MKFKTVHINIQDVNVFFTSDTHFHHKNIIKYCDRPFETVEEMDATIINNWNSVVGKNDIIFHGGDFCFGDEKSWNHLCERLNGIKYLASGNHDKNITPKHFDDVKNMFNIMIDGDEEISDGQRLTICHYPMLSWYQNHRGSWQLYGHLHGSKSNKRLKGTAANQLDIGVDAHNFTPISYQQVKEIITKQNLIQ